MDTHQNAPAAPHSRICAFGGDNRHSIDKARLDLGYAPKVELREGIIRGEWQRVDTAKYAKNYLPPVVAPAK